jgi:autotransporter-associated beta strand protein
LDTNGQNLTFTSGLASSNAGGLTKIGAGTLTLSGANAYAGGTSVLGGTLLADFTAGGAPGTNILPAASSLTLAGGTLGAKFNSGVLTGSQSFASTNIGSTGLAGASAVTITNAGTVSLGAIARYAGATVDFNPGTGSIQTTTPGTFGTNSILGGYATVGGSTWATVSGGAIAGLTSFNSGSFAAASDVDLNAIGTVATTSAIAINSLRISAPGAVTVNTSGALTIASGGILETSAVGTGAVAINNNTITSGSGQDLVVFQGNTGSAMTIASTVVNNGTAAIGLTKSGPGILTLAGSNTFSGPVAVNAGILQMGNSAAVGSSAASVSVANGATLDLHGYEFSAAPTITIAGSGSAGQGALINSINRIGNFKLTLAASATIGVAQFTDLQNTFTNPSGYTLTVTGGNRLEDWVSLGNTPINVQNAFLCFESAGNDTGTITVSASGSLGVIQPSPGSSISAPLILNGGVLESAGFYGGAQPFCVFGGPIAVTTTSTLNTVNGNLLLSGTISGSGGFITSGASATYLTAANAFSGGVNIASGQGSVQLGNVNAVQNSTVTVNNAAGLTFTASANTGAAFNLGGLAGGSNFTLQDTSGNAVTLSVGSNGQSTTYSGAMGGPGGLSKVGAGTLTLTGANTYIGGTTVTSGTLEAATTSSLPANYTTPGMLTVANRATLAVAAGGSGWQATDINNLLTADASGFASGSSLGIDVASGVFSYGNAISVSLGLVKLGTGNLTLTAANSYSGPTTVVRGVLEAAMPAAVPNYSTNLSVQNGATFAVTAGGTGWQAGDINTLLTTGSTAFASGSLLGIDVPNGTFSYTNAIGGGFGLNKLGAGILDVANTNTYTGGTILSGGELNVAGDTNLGGGSSVLDFNGGILQVNGSTLTNLNSYTVNWSTFNGGFDLLSSAATFTVSQTLAGAGSLTKLGPGSLVVSGNNSYAGGTTVGAGLVTIGNTGAFGSGTNITVANGATLDLAGYSPKGSPTVTISGSGTTGQGALVNSSGNTVSSFTVALAANATVDAVVAGAKRFDFGITWNGNGYNLTKIGSGGIDFGGTLNNIPTLNVQQGYVQFETDADNSATTLVVGASGTVAIFGGNGRTLKSPITLNAGTLWNDGVYSASANTDVFSGAVTLTGSATINTGGGPGAGGSIVLSGAVSGSGGFTTTGTYAVVLTNANTFSGGFTVASGQGGLQLGNLSAVQNSTVTVNNTAGLTFTATANLGAFNLGSLAGTGSFTLQDTSGAAAALSVGGNGQSTTYSGVMGGSGGVAKLGSGTLTLTGSNSYSGGTTVSAGTLTIGNNSALGATTGSLTANGGTLDLAGFSPSVGVLAGASGTITSSTGSATLTTSVQAVASTFSGAITGPITLAKAGSGTLTLTGSNNSYTGGTSIVAGRLVVGIANALPVTTTVTFGSGSGTLDLAGNSQTVAGLAGNALVANQVIANSSTATTGTLTFAGGNGDSTFGGTIQDGLDGAGGPTALTVSSGTLTLTGSNVYSGGTSVTGGLLEITSASALPAGTSLTIGAGAGVVFDAGIGSGTGDAMIALSTGKASGTLLAAPLASGAAADRVPSGCGSAPLAVAPAAGGSEVAAVPEPGTLGLLAAGLTGALLAAWRKRRHFGF